MTEHECEIILFGREGCVECNPPPPPSPAELKRREEDEWLRKQKELAHVPDPDLDPKNPPVRKQRI